VVTLMTFSLPLALAGCVQTSTISSPTPTSSPAVIYFENAPAGPWQIVDWDGTLHGALEVRGVGVPQQSPDGSRILWTVNDIWEVLDRTGHVLSRPDITGTRSITWADDSSGLCMITGGPDGGSYELVFASGSGGTRKITTLSSTAVPSVAACSPAGDRVVLTSAKVYKDYPSQLLLTVFSELQVINFTTGQLELSHTFPTGIRSIEVSSVAVTHDGSRAAFGSRKGATVLDLATGEAITTLQSVLPVAFSWDGSLLAVAVGIQAEVLNSSTGQKRWTDSQPDRAFQGAAPRPHGSDVVLMVTTGGLDDLLVVHVDGSTRIIARNAFVDQFTACAGCGAA
jgi:hypothetical protein